MPRSSFGRLFQRPGRRGYYFRVREGSCERVEKAGDTLKAARAFVKRVAARQQRELAGEVIVEPKTFADFADEYLEHAERVKAETTVEKERLRIRRSLVPAFGERLVEDITQADVARWIERVSEGRSVATRNRHLSLMSVMMKYAVQLGYARTNPVAGLGRPQEPTQPIPWLDLDAQRRIVETAHPDLRSVILLALRTGMRQGELMRLEWRDVDLVRGCVLVRQSKTGHPREIPLTGAAHAELERLERKRVRPLDGPDRVFSWLRSKWGGWAQARFARGLDRAGVPRIRFHDLRHLFVTNLVRAGVPLADVAKLSGHKTLGVLLRYADHSPGDSASRAMALLEQMERRESGG